MTTILSRREATKAGAAFVLGFYLQYSYQRLTGAQRAGADRGGINYDLTPVQESPEAKGIYPGYAPVM